MLVSDQSVEKLTKSENPSRWWRGEKKTCQQEPLGEAAENSKEQLREEADERADKSGEAARPLLSAYRLKTSRCSSAAEFRRGEMKTPLTLVSKQKSYLWRGTICPPCELFRCLNI